MRIPCRRGFHGLKNVRGQTLTEFIILLAALAVLAMVVAGLMGMLPRGSLNVKIGESQAYWSSQAGPIKITDWSMRTVNTTVPQLEVASNLSMVLFNPTTQVIVIQAITLSPGNFSQVYYSNGQWAGPADTLSITLHPGEQKAIIVEHWASGPDAYLPPGIYQLAMSIRYTMAFTSSIEAGAVPLVGGNQYVAGEPGTGCPAGLVQCGSGVCAPSSNCCGSTACTAGQFCCASTCCQAGSQLCLNSTCVPVDTCTAPNVKCGNACCNATQICNASTSTCSSREVACGNGSFNPSIQTCNTGSCTGGLNCDPNDCTCTNKTAVFCGAGGFNSSLNFCSPTSNCAVMQYCNVSACECIPKTAVACGAGGFNASSNYCSPTNTCPEDFTCDPGDCTCRSGTALACGTSGFNSSLNICAPTNVCPVNESCNRSICLCDVMSTVACGAGGFNASLNTCSPANCTNGLNCDPNICACTNKTAVACGAGGFNSSVNFCSPIDNCSSDKYCELSSCTCLNKTAVACGDTGFDKNLNTCSPTDTCTGNRYCNQTTCSCLPKTNVTCGGGLAYNNSVNYCSPQNCQSTYVCNSSGCTCVCPSGTTECPSGVNSFYTDVPNNVVVFNQAAICCNTSGGSSCLGVSSDGVDSFVGETSGIAPSSMCCGAGGSACRDVQRTLLNGFPAPGQYTCCYGTCNSYSWKAAVGDPGIATTMCCPAGVTKVCHLDKDGAYACCSGDCVSPPLTWNGGTLNGQPIAVDAMRIETCCAAGSSVYISSAVYGDFTGFAPTFSCCASGNKALDTDDTSLPQLCCPNSSAVAGHIGNLSGANACCAASDSVATYQFQDTLGRIITSTLCCSVPKTALNDSNGRLTCCDPANVANGTNGPFCCPTPAPGGVCGGSTGPVDCAHAGAPACSGTCTGGQTCGVDTGTGLCVCNPPTGCSLVTPGGNPDYCAPGSCEPGKTCQYNAGNDKCYCA